MSAAAPLTQNPKPSFRMELAERRRSLASKRRSVVTPQATASFRGAVNLSKTVYPDHRGDSPTPQDVGTLWRQRENGASVTEDGLAAQGRKSPSPAMSRAWIGSGTAPPPPEGLSASLIPSDGVRRTSSTERPLTATPLTARRPSSVAPIKPDLYERLVDCGPYRAVLRVQARCEKPAERPSPLPSEILRSLRQHFRQVERF